MLADAAQTKTSTMRTQKTVLRLMRLMLAAAACMASIAGAVAAQAAPPGFVPQIIVQMAPASPGSTQRLSPAAAGNRLMSLAAAAGVAVDKAIPMSGGAQVLQLPAGSTPAQLRSALTALRAQPGVADAEPNIRLHLQLVPNDPCYTAVCQGQVPYSNGTFGTGQDNQWDLQNPTLAGAAAINAERAWDSTTGGATVAVLDTGILSGWPDLQNQILPGYDMISTVDAQTNPLGRNANPADLGDWVTSAESANVNGPYYGCPVSDSSWHGTFIAGEIAAMGNDGQNIAGISWGSKILPVRVAGKCGALLSDVIDGIRWAVGMSVPGAPANPNPARVVNISFGGTAPCGSALQSAIDDATARGALVVTAAGNESGTIGVPANCQGVAAVGAANQNGGKATYSDYGDGISLMAPGGDLSAYNTDPGLISLSNSGATTPSSNVLRIEQGTSFAAPMVSGVASLMLARNPQLTPASLLALMENSARPFPAVNGLATCDTSAQSGDPNNPSTSPAAQNCNCTTATCGAGLLDAAVAVQNAVDPVAVISATPASPLTGASVTLSSAGSSPSPGASLATYQWAQTAGPAVTLSGANAATATFIAPAPATYGFSLTVTDSAGHSSTSQTQVVVTAPAGSSGGGSAADPLELLALGGLVLVALRGGRRSRN